MSLDIDLIDPIAPDDAEPLHMYSTSVTNNLTMMAKKAGIYDALWWPENLGATHAKDIIDIVAEGFLKLKSNPEFYKQFEDPQGWGTYSYFLPFVAQYLEALKQFPEAKIKVHR